MLILNLLNPGIIFYLLNPGIILNLLNPGIIFYLLNPGIILNLLNPGIILNLLNPGIILNLLVLNLGIILNLLHPGFISKDCYQKNQILFIVIVRFLKEENDLKWKIDLHFKMNEKVEGEGASLPIPIPHL